MSLLPKRGPASQAVCPLWGAAKGAAKGGLEGRLRRLSRPVPVQAQLFLFNSNGSLGGPCHLINKCSQHTARGSEMFAVRDDLRSVRYT